MNALGFAWRALVRQPLRTLLAILGIMGVGALLFDMLMLSNGLVISMQDLLERSGFDLRVSTGAIAPGSGPQIQGADSVAAALERLPEVEAAVPIRIGAAEVAGQPRREPLAAILGAETRGRRIWTVVEGRDLRSATDGEALVNEELASRLGHRPGATVRLRGDCDARVSATPPLTVTIVGVADFPFDPPSQRTVAISLRDFDRLCGGDGNDVADQILVAAAEASGADAAKTAISRSHPDLVAYTNAQMVAQLQGGLSYFRQISLVLITVTIAFALLLVTVLLTVSVNQRLGEIAALRALGFSQRRVVADVFCESALLVGAGGLLALPAGLLLARGLDWILRGIGVPADAHFFVYQHQALAVHGLLFALTALLAAAYPMWIVARLPIAATLRDEVVS